MFCKQLNRKHQSIINNRAKEKDAFIFVGMCQANNIFSHKKSVAHFSTVGITL